MFGIVLFVAVFILPDRIPIIVSCSNLFLLRHFNVIKFNEIWKFVNDYLAVARHCCDRVLCQPEDLEVAK